MSNISKASSNTTKPTEYEYHFDGGSFHDFSILDKQDGKSDWTITDRTVLDNYISEFDKEAGNKLSQNDKDYINDFVTTLMKDGGISTVDELSIIGSILRYAIKDNIELGKNDISDRKFKDSYDNVNFETLSNRENFTKDEAEAFLYMFSVQGNSNISTEEISKILNYMDDLFLFGDGNTISKDTALNAFSSLITQA